MKLTSIAALRRIRVSWWIVIINLVSSASVLALYLSNRIIPATIGSQPNGELYVDLIKIAIIIKALTTAFAVAEITSRALPETWKQRIAYVTGYVLAFSRIGIRILLNLRLQPQAYTRFAAVVRSTFLLLKGK